MLQSLDGLTWEVRLFMERIYTYLVTNIFYHGFPQWLSYKKSTFNEKSQETGVQSLGWEDPLEKEMATHFSVLAWRIPWTEEPGGLQSMRSQRVGHD